MQGDLLPGKRGSLLDSHLAGWLPNAHLIAQPGNFLFETPSSASAAGAVAAVLSPPA